MRSGSGTKSVEPSLVTFSTKATMAFLGAVSFHDGNASSAAPRRKPARSSKASVGMALLAFVVIVILRLHRVPRQVATKVDLLPSREGSLHRPFLRACRMA